MLVLEIKNELQKNISQVPTTQSCQPCFDYIRKSYKGEEIVVKKQIFLYTKKN